MNEVVITGVGACTPLGEDLIQIQERLQQGVSGITLCPDEQSRGFPVHHGGYVRSLRVEHRQRETGHARVFALAHEAADSALLGIAHDYDPMRCGVLIGAEPPFRDLIGTLGDRALKTLPGASGLHPYLLLTQFSQRHRLRGPAYLHLGTCSAATQAIGEAALMIQSGRCDLMLCGGVSSRVDPLSMLRLVRVGALALTDRDPHKVCRPFDKTRNGFTMAEGAIFFVLERREQALRRGLLPLARVSGYGAALDGYSITDPHPDALGMRLAMQRALDHAGLTPQAISYLNAHGTSTEKNDKQETLAIKRVFGEAAYALPISSTKSLHGHLMSAAGAMEALCSLLAIRGGFIPPTLNLDTPDPECDLDYTPHSSRPKILDHVLTNSFGLGGQNASLILSRESS